MKKNGIPLENIIHFAKDDIANSPNNPFPGQLFNKPNGPNVYEGCQIDYKGADVTPARFLSVLRGETQPDGKKTLKTGSDDKIFIFFSDHGSPGLIAFPNQMLFATDLMDTLHFMNDNHLYKEMVIYIEACESGSMFENLLTDDMNIYATTAANSVESSWGHYCYPDDVINGKHIGSCLGDYYSINWMEDSDSKDSCSETIGEQFDIVKAKTTNSHVMEFGDKNIKPEVVGNFEGTCDAPSVKDLFSTYLNKLKGLAVEPFGKTYTSWDSRDIKVQYLFHKYMDSKDQLDAMELQDEIQHRTLIETKFDRLEKTIKLGARQGLKNHQCYKELVNEYVDACGNDEYSLKYFYVFAELCNQDMMPKSRIDLLSVIC